MNNTTNNSCTSPSGTSAPNKKKLTSSTSLSTTTSPTSSSPSHGFLQKTLNHLPLFFTNHNLASSQDDHHHHHNHNQSTPPTPSHRPDSASPVKRDFFKLKLKVISPNVSPTSSPPFNNKSLLTPVKRQEHFSFNELDTNSHYDDTSSQISQLGAAADLQLSPKTPRPAVRQQKLKLKHQAFSLSSAFSSLTSSSLLIPQLASSNVINNSLMQSTSVVPSLATQSTEKIITKSGNSKQITTVDTLTAKTTLLNSGLLFSRSNKNLKTNYKEHINTKNVRRRSSTLNANMCFLSTKHNTNSTLHECALATNQFLKAINKMNSRSDEAGLNTGSDSSTLTKVNSDSMAHLANRISVNSSIGVIVGASDIKFRKKLLKLQQRQQDFTYAASTYLPTGLERRKKAFAADNLSYTDYDESDEVNAENASSFNNDNNSDFNNNKSIVRRLSRAISAVSLIVADDENQNCDKLSLTKVSLTSSLTDVNEDLINEKNNEIGRVTKWAIGFEKLLQDPLGLQIFTEFLKKEFSQENIDFWVKCDNFEKLTDEEEMKRVANEIWSVYLDTSSMTQINVDSKSRASCKEALQNPNNKMFEKAKAHIFNLMRYDSYSRFLKSQLYKDCICNEMAGKPLLSTTTTSSSSTTTTTLNQNNKLTSTDSNSKKIKIKTTSPSPINSNNQLTSSNKILSSSPSSTRSNLNLNSDPSSSANQAASTSSNLNQQLQISSPDLQNLNLNASNTSSASQQTAMNSSFPFSSSSLTNINNPNANNSAASNSTGNNLSSTSSSSSAADSASNKKEKKRSTIIPWTKAFIKWKRLSGKEKKPTPASDSFALNHSKDFNPGISNQIPSQQQPAVVKTFTNKTPLIVSTASSVSQQQQLSTSPTYAISNSETKFSNFNDSTSLLNQSSMESSGFLNASLTLSNQVEGKFCRVIHNDSTTIIQAISGQTISQCLSKLFIKKQIPWYKCDLYFNDDLHQQIDLHMDADVIASKEICLVERCLFALSLIPIAINLCIKANHKKCIGNILQPILDLYQVDTSECAIYLNSTTCLLNLKDSCSSVDNQHILIVHKHQASLLSQMEIDKYIRISISDFIPNNLQDYSIEFDELGILKQKCKTSNKHRTLSKNSSFLSNLNNSSGLNPQSTDHHQLTLSAKLNKTNEDQGNLIELLKRAQNFSLEDQRGRIDTKNLELPEFLLNPSASNLTKSQSLNQNINLEPTIKHLVNTPNTSYQPHSIINNNSSVNNTKKKNNLIGAFNESTSSLPVQMSSNLGSSPLLGAQKQQQLQKSLNAEFNTSNRSRSPIMIVYDHDEMSDLNQSASTTSRLQHHKHYPSTTNTPVKLNRSETAKLSRTQISYV